MIRLLIWMLLVYIGYRILKAMLSGKDRQPDVVHDKKDAEVETTYQDPVCGVYVSENEAVVGRLDGQRHYFCSMTCLETFREQLDHKTT